MPTNWRRYLYGGLAAAGIIGTAGLVLKASGAMRRPMIIGTNLAPGSLGGVGSTPFKENMSVPESALQSLGITWVKEGLTMDATHLPAYQQERAHFPNTNFFATIGSEIALRWYFGTDNWTWQNYIDYVTAEATMWAPTTTLWEMQDINSFQWTGFLKNGGIVDGVSIPGGVPAYVEMAKHASAIVKGINPKALVLALGGLQLMNIDHWFVSGDYTSSPQYQWTSQAFSLGIGNYVDGLSLELYTQGPDPVNCVRDVYAHWYGFDEIPVDINTCLKGTKTVRQICLDMLNLYGSFGKPFYIEESGIPTNRFNSSIDFAGQWATDLLATMNSFPSVAGVFWWDMIGSTGNGDDWGMLNLDSTPRPSGVAFQTFRLQHPIQPGGTLGYKYI